MKIDLYLENIVPAVEEATDQKVFVIQFQPTKVSNTELLTLLNVMKEHKISVVLKE